MIELHLVTETSVAQMITEETVEIVDTIEMMTDLKEMKRGMAKMTTDRNTEIGTIKKMIETEVEMMIAIGIETVTTEMMIEQVEIGEKIEERDRKIEIGKFGQIYMKTY